MKIFKEKLEKYSPSTTFNKAKSGAGFSIIEMIVVVAITVILSSILIGYSKTSEQQIVFFKEQSLLTSSIFKAKTFAVETFQPSFQPSPGSPPISSGSTERVCGWGVSFKKNLSGADEYTIFRDIVPVGSDCSSATKKLEGPIEGFETIIIDPLVAISCMDIVTSGANCSLPGRSNVDLVFIPPNPTVSFSPIPGDEIVVELELVDPLVTRKTTIRINQAGQISVK